MDGMILWLLNNPGQLALNSKRSIYDKRPYFLNTDSMAVFFSLLYTDMLVAAGAAQPDATALTNMSSSPTVSPTTSVILTGRKVAVSSPKSSVPAVSSVASCNVIGLVSFLETPRDDLFHKASDRRS